MSEVKNDRGIRGQLLTEDGQPIVWRRFEPADVREAEGVVIIAAAMGVSQSFYRAFAHWLSEQNFVGVTFDYLGMGESLTGPLAAVPGDIMRWAQQDASAVLGEVLERYVGLPVTWLGHSQAGQTVPFIKQHQALSKLIFATAGSGYWRFTTASVRRISPLLWWVIVPTTLRLLGYFPGERLGIVGNLPQGVMKQWREWCLNPNYLIGVLGEDVRTGFDGVTTPLQAISFEDDELMSRAGISALNDFYRHAPQEWSHISPPEFGLDVVGHMGLFRASNEILWSDVLLPALARREQEGVPE